MRELLPELGQVQFGLQTTVEGDAAELLMLLARLPRL